MIRYEKILARCEFVAVIVLELLLLLAVGVATLVLVVLFFKSVFTRALQIESMDTLQDALEHTFSGVLLVLLGLELLETLKTYFKEHHIRIQVILVVALISVARYLIQVNFEKTNALTMIGLGGLIVSLSVGYFLVCKAHVLRGAKAPDQ